MGGGSFRRAALAILAPALLLAGCTLHSAVPLIERSEVPPEIAPGTYGLFVVADAKSVRKIPQPYRAACLDPGYTVAEKDKDEKPTGKRLRAYYCSYDTDKKAAIPTARLVRSGDGLRAETADASPPLRFQRVRDGLYLVESDDSTDEKKSFGYSLYRTRPPALEVFLLLCDSFPSVKKAGDYETADCEISSLESIKPELDAFIGRIDAGEEVPFVILKRVGD